MSINIKGGGNYIPAPDGLHRAVCVDVVDLGDVTTTWNGHPKTQRKIKLVFELDSLMPDGRPFTTQKRYTASLHEKAALRKDLKSWRGRDFTSDELKEFDIEKVLGAPAQVVIVHEEREGETWANISVLMKAGENKLKPTGTYKRAKDRDGYKPPAVKQAQEEPAPEGPDMADDDIPF